jgi:hypothetical protein
MAERPADRIDRADDVRDVEEPRGDVAGMHEPATTNADREREAHHQQHPERGQQPTRPPLVKGLWPDRVLACTALATPPLDVRGFIGSAGRTNRVAR